MQIYADDSTLYQSTSSVTDDPMVAAGLSSNLEEVVQWGKRWFVSFNAPKTKLASFHHKRTVQVSVLFKWTILPLRRLHA